MDPSLQPWDFDKGETFFEANPHVLQEDHYLRHNCIGHVWMDGYEKKKSSSANQSYGTIHTYCDEHSRMEPARSIYTQILMQLAFGLFSFEEWVLICAHMWDSMKKGDKAARLAGHDYNGKERERERLNWPRPIH